MASIFSESRARCCATPVTNACARAAQEPLTIADFDPARESVAPYFIDYVNRVSEARAPARALSDTEPLAVASGSDAGRMPADHRQDAGAPLITTLDLDLQRIAS